MREVETFFSVLYHNKKRKSIKEQSVVIPAKSAAGAAGATVECLTKTAKKYNKENLVVG